MKLNSLRVSNILSFEHKDNIDDCQEVKFDDNLNVLIGPNATGKSNFLEIISQLFKAGLIMGCRYNTNALYQYEKTGKIEQLRELITPHNRRPHSLPKNYSSDSDKKMIKVKLTLNDDDRANLFFIKQKADKIIELSSKYSSQTPYIDKSISDDDINNAKTFTFTFFSDSSNATLLIPKEDGFEKIDKVVLNYFYWFQFIQILIVIAKDREGQDWSLLKSTFALMSSYRSYSDFNSEFNINDQLQNQKNKIPERLYQDGPKTVGEGQPIIFDYVKDLLLDQLVLVEKELSKGKINNEGKSSVELIDTEILRNINKTLKEQLNLEFKVEHRSPNQYYFYFEDIESELPIQVSDLSGGQKEIIHFVFSVFGHDLENGVIIIDELELHLHPQKQKQMLEIIKSITAKLDIQFIIATHSSIFVLPNTIAGVHRFYMDDKKYTKIVNPTISENERDLVQFLTYTNSSKIFFSEKVILVEGDSDEYFFQYYFDHYQKIKLKKYDNIEFLYMEGKDRYSFWYDFLNKFKIKTYFIGDLDNILSDRFFIINSSDLNSIKNEFDLLQSTISNMQSNSKYLRDTKCYNKDLLKYIQTSKDTEWLQIKNNIESKYNDKIFILKEGELENYTDSNKKLKGVIDFCKNGFANWIENSGNTAKISELNKIFDEITRDERIREERLVKQQQIRDIFLGFVQVFTNSMNVIKPIKNDPYDRSGLTFEERFYAWQHAFEFPKELAVNMSDFADHLVYGGNNIEDKLNIEIQILPKFTDDLDRVLNSGKFYEYMEIAKPNLPDDPRSPEKIKAWEDSFNVTKKLQGFVTDVKNAMDHSDDGFITGIGHHAYIESLIKRLQSN